MPRAKTTPAHGGRAHAWASPSSLARLMHCPAAPSLLAMLPPEKRDPTSAAGIGEAIHERAETHLRKWTTPAHDDADADVLIPYLDAIRDAAGGRSGVADLGNVILVEEKVDVYPPDCYGTFDAAVVCAFDRTLYVFDLKTGCNFVPAKENVQLGAYAIGLLRRFAGKRRADWDGWRVCLCIVGGRFGLDDPVLRWWTTPEWLWSLQGSIRDAVKVSRQNPPPPPQTGPGCEWCRVVQCPARLKETASVFPVVEPDDAAPAPAEPPSPELLPAETLSHVLAVAGRVRQWLKKVEEYCLENPPPGWTTAPGRAGNRRWIDDKVAASALNAAGIPPFDAVLKSPTAVERETGKAPFAELLGALVERPPGKPRLVPDPAGPTIDPGLPLDGSFPIIT